MHERSRWTTLSLATITLALSIGWVTERLDHAAAPHAEVGESPQLSSDLVTLGPLSLISGEYTVTLTFPCDDDQNASATFSATDIPTSPPGTSITSAGFNFNVSSGWVGGLSGLSSGVISVSGTHAAGGCGSINEMVIVSGQLSGGHNYTVTINFDHLFG